MNHRTIIPLLCVIALAGSPAFGQPVPQYALTIGNPVLTGNVYQFDILLERVGATNFRVGNSQFILAFNAGAFSSPAIGRVPGSEQIGSGFFFDQEISGNAIRISLGGNGIYANAVDIAAAAPGTRISTFRISGVTTSPLSAGLAWVNLPTLVRTGVSEINSLNNYRDITDSTGLSHINGGGEFARLSGSVFDDLNGNGSWDQPAEPALNGWIITLSGPGGPRFDTSGSGSRPPGFYEFVNLTPGVYSVTESLQTGWSQTLTPPSPILLAAGTDSTMNNFGNFNGPTVRGIVFNDLNGDSLREAGEPGASGWQITATKSGGGSKSQTTGPGGNYVFTFLPSEIGTWQITETPQPGWIQTLPVLPPSYQILVQSGTNESGKNFGNFHAGTISGTKFNDFTRDSVREGFEPGIRNWIIRLSKGGSQIDSAVTDTSGGYSFTGLAAGTYVVSENQVAGWVQTVPAAPGIYTIGITTGGVLSAGNDFGNYHAIPTGGVGIISGKKFQDSNGDSTFDAGDSAIAGWKIRLSIGSTVIDSALTDSAGNYAFTTLDDGIYLVSEEQRIGWQQTFPGGAGRYQIMIGPAQRVFAGRDFGNFAAGSASGIVYYDLNHNGSLDSGEQGMQGIRVDIAGPNGSSSAMTGPGGAYAFASLLAGAYTLTEQVPAGYHLTEPPGGAHSILVGSGANITGLNFGNSPAADTARFRTFSYDSLALARDLKGRVGKRVKPGPNKVQFCISFINQTGQSVTGLHMNFTVPLFAGDSLYPLMITPAPAIVSFSRSNRLVDVEFPAPIGSGDTVAVCGWGTKGRVQSTVYFWSAAGHFIKPQIPVRATQFPLNALRWPLPNAANLRDEVYFQRGFGNPQTGGLVVGIPRPDSAKFYGWVRLRSGGDVRKSFYDRFRLHSIITRGFDYFDDSRVSVRNRPFIHEQRFLPPTKQDNRVFAEIAALKLNIAASDLGILPRGLGDLVYTENTSTLDGLSVRQIVSRADSTLTFWRRHSSVEYEAIDSAVRKINLAFQGRVDTVSFAGGLIFNGARSLQEVAFLRANPGGPTQERLFDRLEGPDLPMGYALYQNFPNPFNPATTIRFDLPTPARVTLIVYNILGQEVRRLIDGRILEDGTNEVVFDASNLPSGVYFYRLVTVGVDDDGNPTSSGFALTKKMMLIR